MAAKKYAGTGKAKKSKIVAREFIIAQATAIDATGTRGVPRTYALMPSTTQPNQSAIERTMVGISHCGARAREPSSRSTLVPVIQSQRSDIANQTKPLPTPGV